MPGLLSSAELAVFPSLIEATSVAALESMACELPVAASNVGGLPEMIDGEVGALFEAGNPTALAATVTSLLERADLRSLGAAARSRVVERWSNARPRWIGIWRYIRVSLAGDVSRYETLQERVATSGKEKKGHSEAETCQGAVRLRPRRSDSPLDAGGPLRSRDALSLPWIRILTRHAFWLRYPSPRIHGAGVLRERDVG